MHTALQYYIKDCGIWHTCMWLEKQHKQKKKTGIGPEIIDTANSSQ